MAKNIVTPNDILIIGIETSSLEMVRWAINLGANNIDEAYKLLAPRNYHYMEEILLESEKIKDVNFVLNHGVEALHEETVEWALDHGADNVDESVCYLYGKIHDSYASYPRFRDILNLLFKSGYITNWECALGLAAFSLNKNVLMWILIHKEISRKVLQLIYDILEYIELAKRNRIGTQFDYEEERK